MKVVTKLFDHFNYDYHVTTKHVYCKLRHACMPSTKILTARLGPKPLTTPYWFDAMLDRLGVVSKHLSLQNNSTNIKAGCTFFFKCALQSTNLQDNSIYVCTDTS